MLAVELEAPYAEQAKERKGSRTDLGLNLGQGEFGRSAEKAAKVTSLASNSQAKIVEKAEIQIKRW
jgi:hypothetical protein